MDEHIPSDGEMMGQASRTANEYLIHAVDSIDRALGEGYAKKNPELIGAFMQAAALDFLTSQLHHYAFPELSRIADWVERLE
jgi:hypothetical protein